MTGYITKKDFFSVCKIIGVKAGIHLLLSREPVALNLLIKCIMKK